MAERRRRSFGGPPDDGFGPGQLVRAFTARNGWKILQNNVMFEGVSDVKYFELASELHQERCGLRLLGTDLAMIACGKGDEGGVSNLHDKFRSLANVIEADPYDDSGREFRVIAVFDDDHAGRKEFSAITSSPHSPWQAYRHAFLLKRRFPRIEKNLPLFKRLCDQLNSNWGGMDCEVEDLFSRSLLERFIAANPDCIVEGRCIRAKDGIGHHYEWREWAKASLVTFLSDEAEQNDVSLLVDLLKCFRSLLDLPPDGI